MTQVRLHAVEPIDWTDALVLVAFPTTGSASSIAGHYLQHKMELPLVGSFHVRPGPPVVAVRNGIATSPVRIFGGEIECKLPAGQCPRLYLILTDLPLPPASFPALSKAILEATKNARLVLCMDAVVREEGDDIPDVYAATPNPAVLPYLELEGVEDLGDAFIGGMTGRMLLDCTEADCNTRTGALVVEAAPNIPDGRAAAALIEAIDELLPLVPVDPGPLIEEALELEAEIRKAQEAAERQNPRAPVDMDHFI